MLSELDLPAAHRRGVRPFLTGWPLVSIDAALLEALRERQPKARVVFPDAQVRPRRAAIPPIAADPVRRRARLHAQHPQPTRR